MSNIYIKEPATDGKVLLQTSVGDIDIELWSKEAPLTCRNFVQLCMEGYYDGTIFHRVVPGSIVQGGDPTGTGTGGESIYGKPFKDEFHQRLRFARRGLVAMANAGPNDNTSQFFFTLGPCNDLNKKHTIFGKVTGDTVYNMITLGDVNVDTNERPVNPSMIKKTKVIANPFDDIIPRVEPEKQKKTTEKKKKSQSRATKDYKLLSFGDEAEIDEEESTEVRFTGPKSSHDLTHDPRLSSKTAIETPTTPSSGENEENSNKEESSSSDEESKKERTDRIRDKLTKKKTEQTDQVQTTGDVTDKIKQMRKESRQIARELSKKKQEEKSDNSNSESDDDVEDSSNPVFAEYKAQQKEFRAKTSVVKKKGSGREQETLQLLNSFKTKMFAVRKDADWNESDDEIETATVRNSKFSLEDDDSDDGDNVGWLMHKLKKDNSELRDAKDMNKDVNEDRYEITDPRNPLNKRRRKEKDDNDRNKRRRHHDDRHSRSDNKDRDRHNHRDRDRHSDRHRQHRK